MIRRRTGVLAALLAVAALLVFSLRGQEPEEPPTEPVLASSVATLEIGDRRGAVSYSTTPAGTLFTLHPIVTALGGELTLGPLGQSHTVTLGESVFVFGAGSRAVTQGEELLFLSQAPQAGPEGLRVPVELLQRLYTDNLGYDFEWRAADRTLAVLRHELREVPLDLDFVHLQGVTTTVLQFAFRPRFRVDEMHDRVAVELLGDRVRWDAEQEFPSDRFIRNVVVAPEKVTVHLQRGAAAQTYTLEDPFRIVVDTFAGAPLTANPVASGGPTELVRPKTGRTNTIVIDPGHGGGDTGAVGASGIEEKTLTLQLARRLRRSLQSRLPVRVVLTRDEDADLPLQTRAALANQMRADLFISLHINSAFSAGAHGAETYFLSLEASDERAARAAEEANRQGTASPVSTQSDLEMILWDMAQTRHLAQSQQLATLIQGELNEAMGLTDRGVKQAPFTVLMGAAMPAVLVELGFLSNPAEEVRLQDPQYQSDLIAALVRAITRFRARNAPADPEVKVGAPQ